MKYFLVTNTNESDEQWIVIGANIDETMAIQAVRNQLGITGESITLITEEHEPIIIENEGVIV